MTQSREIYSLRLCPSRGTGGQARAPARSAQTAPPGSTLTLRLPLGDPDSLRRPAPELGRPGPGGLLPDPGWFDTDYRCIDQGPIVLLIENLRSELIWKHKRRNPHIIRGLRRAGFTGGWLATASGS